MLDMIEGLPVKDATRQPQPLRRWGRAAGYGRAKGTPNKVKAEIAEVARQLTLGNQKFIERLRVQLEAGKCHPMIVKMLFAYGYGEPPKKIQVTLDTDATAAARSRVAALTRDERRAYYELQKAMRARVVNAVEVQRAIGTGSSEDGDGDVSGDA